MRRKRPEYEIYDGGIFIPHEESEWKKIGSNRWVIFGNHYLFFEDRYSEGTGNYIENGIQYSKEYMFRHHHLVAPDVYLVVTLSEGDNPDDEDSIWISCAICSEEPKKE